MKFAEDTQQGEIVGIPEGCVAIQRNLERLEKWPNRNFMKFSKGRHKVLPLGRNKLRHQLMLVVKCVESSFARGPVRHQADHEPANSTSTQVDT